MEHATYVIVGGGVAGTTAATAIRHLDSTGKIVIISAEKYPLYSRLALSSFTRGQTTKDQLFLRDADFFHQRHIELYLETAASSLDPEQRVVTLQDGRRLQYEKLLLAGGSTPRPWSVPGSDLPGVFPHRTLDQAEQILRLLPRTKHAMIIGGGFITLEHIQTLAQAGIVTTVVIRDPYYWSERLDHESSQLIQQWLNQASNVRLLYQTQVESVQGNRKVETVLLSNGQQLQVDLVLNNIGVDPTIEWLQSSGVDVQGGVVTNAQLQTSDPHIWAAGDIAMFQDTLLGVHHRLGNWDNASAQGQLAGHNMASSHSQAFQTLSTYSITFMGHNISFVGDIHHHAAMTAVPRGSWRSGAYGRLLLHNDRLVGATLLNRFTERPAIEQLITSRAIFKRRDILDLTDESIPLTDLAQRLARK